jgi:hypothetical protein
LSSKPYQYLGLSFPLPFLPIGGLHVCLDFFFFFPKYKKELFYFLIFIICSGKEKEKEKEKKKADELCILGRLPSGLGYKSITDH